MQLHVWGQQIVLLNSQEAAFDLLQQWGSIYSNRMHMVMAGEL